MTPRSEMHQASFVFGSDGLINSTGGWNSGVAFLFGLLSVQWTVSTSSLDARMAVSPSDIPDDGRTFVHMTMQHLNINFVQGYDATAHIS